MRDWDLGEGKLLNPEDSFAARRAFQALLARVNSGGGGRLTEVASLYSADVAWHGSRPLGDCNGSVAVVRRVWEPLIAAFPDVERRDEILVAGTWREQSWVAATGHYIGRFRGDWLGIPAHGRVATLRFGEFSRVRAGVVCEAYVIFDILDLMRQAGVWPLAPPLGNSDRVPAPATQDGLTRPARDQAESSLSLQLVEAMIAGLMRFDRKSLDSMDQSRFWHPDFTWYGPAGIGTCRGQDDYRRVHQRPFLTAFPDRVGGDHKCRIAEGAYVASTGWPSIRATHSGSGFLGLPATQKRVTMRVMDFWRREGDLLRENWVFIDLLDLLNQMGFDVMARMSAARSLIT